MNQSFIDYFDLQHAKTIEEIADKMRNLNRAMKLGNTYIDEILSDLYSTPTHFIFELLQNADDSNAKHVYLSLEEDRLIFTHDGDPFDIEDIKRICAVNDSAKKMRKGKIGQFGIGFKSVYSICKTPEIFSGDFKFKIKDYRVPEKINSDESFTSNTKIILPFESSIYTNDDIKRQISNSLKLLDEDTLLFINSITNIHIEDKEFISKENGTLFSDNGKYIINTQIKIGTNIVHYLLFEKEFELLNSKTNETDIKKCQIAYKMVDGKINMNQESTKLMVFFPTQQDTKVRLKVNGPFKTQKHRESVDYADGDNKYILEQLVELYKYSIIELKRMNLLTYEVISQLPIKKVIYYNWDSLSNRYLLQTRFFEETKELFQKEELIQTIDGEFVAHDKVLLLRNFGLQDLLSENELKLIFGNRSKWISKKTLSSDNYDDQEDRGDLYDFLTKELLIPDLYYRLFLNSTTDYFWDKVTNQWLIKFYRFSLSQIGTLSDSNYNQLKNRKFIRLGNGSMIAPMDSNGVIVVFLPTSENNYDSKKDIHRDLLSDSTSLEFFSKIGIKKASNFEFIKNDIEKYLLNSMSVTDYIEYFEMFIEAFMNSGLDEKKDIIAYLSNKKIFIDTNNNKHIGKDILIPTDDLLNLYNGYDEVIFLNKEVYETVSMNLDCDTYLEELGLRKHPKIIETKRTIHSFSSYFAEDHPGKDINYSQGGGGSDYSIDGLEFIISNINPISSKILWRFLSAIDLKYSEIEISYKVKYGSWEKLIKKSSLTEKLNDYSWIYFDNKKCKPSDVRYSSINSVYLPHHFISRLDFIKEATLPPEVEQRLFLSEGYSNEDIKSAFELLEQKKKSERLMEFKGDYILNILENTLNINLNEKQKISIYAIDFRALSIHSNQKVIFDILKANKKTIKEFNMNSDLKFNTFSFFESLLNQQLSINERGWKSSLYNKMIEATDITEQRQFSKLLTQYDQFEFNDLFSIETELDIDFDYDSFYNSIDFLKYDKSTKIINLNEKYNLSKREFECKLLENNISNEKIDLFLNIVHNQSYMYLGMIDHLFEEYKKYLDVIPKKIVDDSSNMDITFRKATTKPVYIDNQRASTTSTKHDIERSERSKSAFGLKAETIVYKYLNTMAEGVTDIDWVSENADKDIYPNGKAGLGYDFKYKQNELTYFVEVKSSKKYSKKLILTFSKNEIKFARKANEQYLIFICNGTGTQNPKIECVDNIFISDEFEIAIFGEGFAATPSGFDIYLEVED